jgi:hypothetical protein
MKPDIILFTMETPTENIILKTYRYVLSNEIIEYISEFAKIHQYDDRKSFKEEWDKWIKSEDVEPVINDEVKRLTSSGFKGDVVNKMFKSARYYYRNKSENDQQDETKTRKQYETVPRYILDNIDKHIHDQIKNNATNGISTISPAESFNNYLAENKSELLSLLQESNNTNLISKKNVEDMLKKFKKTYKNRFYNIRVSHNNQ